MATNPAMNPPMPQRIQDAYDALPRLPQGGGLDFSSFITNDDTGRDDVGNYMAYQNVRMQQLMNTIDTLNLQVTTQQNTINQQQTLMNGFQQVNQAPPGAQAPPGQPGQAPIWVNIPPLNIPPAPNAGPKIPKPQPFKGERQLAKAFINSLELYFSMRPNDFPTNGSKIKYALLLCEDRAATWGAPIMEEIIRTANNNAIGIPTNPSPRSEFWDDFKADFNLNFADPDEKRSAQTKITNLRQTGGADTYTAEFRRLVSILEWTEDNTLMYLYRKGLKDHVIDMMLAHPEPTTFSSLAELAIKLDNRHFQRQQEKRVHTTTPSNPRPNNNPFPRTNTQAQAQNPAPRVVNLNPGGNSTRRTYNQANPFVPLLNRLGTPLNPGPAAPRDPNAMDLSANRRTLTAAEKQYRFANKLCLYCGQAGHQAAAHHSRVVAATGEEEHQVNMENPEEQVAATESVVVMPPNEAERKNPFQSRS